MEKEISDMKHKFRCISNYINGDCNTILIAVLSDSWYFKVKSKYNFSGMSERFRHFRDTFHVLSFGVYALGYY